MDQKRTGAYIASKRKQNNMTQAQLAEKLNISTNAVSKWERGLNLPDTGLMPELCQLLGITLNELFAGKDIESPQIVTETDHNLYEALQNSTFTLQERITYYRRKWLKEHMFDITVSLLVWIGFTLFLFHKDSTAGFAIPVSVISALAVFVYNRNRMMIYIEDRAFGKHDDSY
ncbi:MAG: helix-turn-helix domain-containing protein [Bulleidia sp.]